MNPATDGGLKKFNLNLGTRAKRLAIDTLERTVQELAVRTAHAIGLELAAVDIVYDHAGGVYVLEVNSGLSLEYFALSSPLNRRAVVDFYTHVLRSLF